MRSGYVSDLGPSAHERHAPCRHRRPSRQAGRLAGYLAYTLACAQRRFDLINRGRAYPAQRDRLHDLAAVARLRLLGSWHLGAAFTFQTSQPLSLPAGAYVTDDPFLGGSDAGSLAYDFLSYNGSRGAPYHRLDLSLEGDLVRIRGTRSRSRWTCTTPTPNATRSSPTGTCSPMKRPRGHRVAAPGSAIRRASHAAFRQSQLHVLRW